MFLIESLAPKLADGNILKKKINKQTMKKWARAQFDLSLELKLTCKIFIFSMVKLNWLL